MRSIGSRLDRIEQALGDRTCTAFDGIPMVAVAHNDEELAAIRARVDAAAACCTCGDKGQRHVLMFKTIYLRHGSGRALPALGPAGNEGSNDVQ